MIDQLLTLIVNEGKWLPVSMGLALVCVAILVYRHDELPARSRVTAAMNLFFGVMIGTMAFGHLLAVTTKLVRGTLEGPTPLFYAIGIALAVPSWTLIHHAGSLFASNRSPERKTLILNAWLALTLLALGLHNLPLAIPGFFNIGYQLHSRRVVGWVIVSLALIVNLGLFIGALIFMASGQSFEQFSGIE